MYVNHYTREMMNEGDTQPIGIVLCADKERIEGGANEKAVLRFFIGMGYGKLQNGYGKSSIEKYFKDCDDIDFLDAIDYFFYLIDKKIRTIKPEYQYDYDADGAINAVIAELNYRFKQHNLGYEFANSQIITIPDEYTDYALHLAATNFLFLVRLYRNKKQNYD